MTINVDALRALEKDIRDSVNESNATHTHLRAHGWADRLASLIAELGQEVGAVEMPLTDDEHEWLMYAVDHMLDDSEPEDKTCARVLQGLLDRCVVSSPAHTSEARDAEWWRFCTGEHELENGEVAKMHVNVGVNVWRGKNWLAYHECSPDEAREIINGIAAMRQEGGSDA